jgi:pilus assembly protein CpaF
MSDGRRKVVGVQEILGMEGDIVTMQEIYKFERAGADAEGNVLGHHRSCAVRPKFLQRVVENGIPVPAELFKGE